MPQSLTTSCTDLLDLLKKAVLGTPGAETLTLTAALLPAAGDLIGYLGLTSLEIKQLDATTPVVQSGGSVACVLITGTAELFLAGTAPVAYKVVIQADTDGATVTMLLQGTPVDAATWGFSGNFVELPKYMGFADQTLKLLPSFYNTMVVAEPVFWVATVASTDHPLGLSFSGKVDMTKGDLAVAGVYFPDATKMPLTGPITMRTGTFPLLQLSGDIGSYSIPQLTALSLAFGTADAVASKTDPNEDQPALSTLLLVGTSALSPSLSLQLSAPVLEGDFAWVITGKLAGGPQTELTKALGAMSSYAGNAVLPLPSGMDVAGFYLESVTVVITPSTTPTLDMVGFRVSSVEGKSWTAPVFGLSVTDLYTEWQVLSPLSKPNMIGAVGGTLVLGSGAEAPRLLIDIGLSGITTASPLDVSITAQLDEDYPVPLGALFTQLTGLPIDLDLEITRLLFQAQTGPRTLQFSAALNGEWPFNVPPIKFGEVNFFFQYTPNSVAGAVSVEVSIASLMFLATAAYSTGDGWQFAGSLSPNSQNNTLQAFVDELTDKKYPNLPANLGNITLNRFDIAFATKTGDFSFDGVLSWPFHFEDVFDLTIEAELSLQSPGVPKGGTRKYSGFVRGSLQINSFKFSVIYSFDIQQNSKVSFVFDYQGVTLTCTYAKKGKESILTANLGGVTFGGILDFLVNLVDPSLNFSLPSPWDVLYDISFDNLTLTVNLTTKAVGISYKVGANLGLIEVDTIGLTYVTRAGRSTVMMSLTGKFFDQEYKDDPLAWDLLNDPPPTAAGTGEKLLDLRYVGIGQNVGFRSAETFANVQAVLAAMETDFLPATTEDKNPLDSPLLANLQFAGDGRWLIGADFTLMEAVSLSVVFNDPTLYGLRIALAGDKVKSFSGLDFQILYKKVTDTIGVYHIELTLPQAFRQFNLGAVAITLPIIVVDVYTNGNFRVDFGFPVGTDFSRSFCLQAGPFIGYGGFYFALLDGSTSTRVPRITNGTFSPVIEAGLALSVGLGRTIDKGVFKAGATITLIGIVQGVFGWFNPNDTSSQSAQYYWIQGTVALVGTLFGSVDFVIISAEVSLTLKATLTMTFEAYKAVEVTATFEVTASASVKILFFRVSFSFSMTLEISFTIGSGSTPPWLIEGPAPAPLTLQQQSAWKAPRLSAMYLQRALVALIGVGSGSFDWKPTKVFAQTQPVKLSMMPALTVALPKLTLAAARTNVVEGPAPQAVMALFVPSTVPSGTQSSKSLLRVTQAAADSNPFNLLCAGMLRWALGSYTRPPALGVGGPVLTTDLEAIEQYLGDAANWQEAFAAAALYELMALNYELQISTPMGASGVYHPNLGLLQEAAAAEEVSYTVFPMLPQLQVAYAKLPPVIYGEHNPVTLAWEQALGTYLRQMRSSVADGTEDPTVAAHKATGPVGLAANGPEALSTFVFRDYFAMLTKGAVQSASDLMKAYPFEVSAPVGPSGPGPDSLNSIAAQFQAPPISYRTRQGDTLARVAARFGVHAEEVHELNPHLLMASASTPLEVGTELLVATSVTAVSVAENNADYPLNYIPGVPVSMPVTGVKHQVRAGTGSASESLSAVAYNYGIADVTTIFTDGGAKNVNAINTQLLQVGATLTIPAIVGTGFATKELCAAFYFVRNVGPAISGEIPWYSDLNWYQQWISTENGEHTDPTAPWKVPIVQLVDGALVQSGETTYTQRSGGETAMAADTLALIAGYFAMMQLQPAPYGDAYVSFLASVTAGSGSSFNIPSFLHVVRAGESLSSIASTFGVSVATLVQQNAGAQGVLQLLAVLALPKLNYVVRRDDTLGSVAANLNLTLDELALSVRATAGIFLPYATTRSRLSIPDVPARDADKLITDLVKFGSFNNVSGMVASFLMHGMRVPEPKATIVDKTFPASTPLWSLYELAGQQFPTRGLSGPSGIDAVFKQQQSVPWIRFDAASPSGPTGLPELVVHMDNSFLSNTPAPMLEPKLLAGPASLPLYRETAQQYSFLQTISWQAPGVLNFPGPSGVTGPSGQVQPQPAQPTLWIFPPAMQALTAGATGPASVTPAYELMLQSSDNSTTTQETPLKKFTWAMAVDVTIQQAPAAAGPMANSYVVVGADQSGREDLLKVWTYLESSRSDGDLYLLYAPSTTSTNSKGLASAIADPAKTFVLKSNLTTVTRSNQSLRAEAAVSNYDYSAPLGAVSSFLKLLWEASVTGSGGFYLNYSNKNGGAGLPSELFANGTTTVLTVLFVARDQQRTSGTQRGLFPFNNCALVGENVDPKSGTLFARLAKPGPDDVQRVSTAAPGTVGFYMARRNPDPPSTSSSAAALSPEDQTRSLYSLLGFQLTETAGFKESNQGLPIGSSETPVSGVSGPTGHDVWWYQQKVPVAQFAKENQAPGYIPLPSLPWSGDNPYAGIIGPTGITGPASLSNISVALSFNDVYGNQTAVSVPVGPISIPIGYTDEVIGLSIWPGIGLDFVFHPGISGRVQLESEMTMQTNRYLPSVSYTYDQAHKAAVADKKRYEQIYYQVQQHDLNFEFDINLGKSLIGPESLKAPIACFVTKANSFLYAALSLEEHQYATLDGDTMNGISGTFGVTPEMLVAANPDHFVQALFKGQMVQPILMTAAPMNSLQALVQGRESKPEKPVCPDTTVLTSGATAGTGEAWISGLRFGHAPAPSAPKSAKALVAPLTVAELAEKNAKAPLTPGNLLIIQPTTSSKTFSTDDTMATIAKSLQCAVYAVSPDGPQDGDVFVGLYVDNFKAGGVVTPNKEISIGGITNSTGTAPTLESVESSFAALNWSRGDFVQNLQTVQGLFLTTAKLAYATFYVPQPVSTSTTTAPPVFALANIAANADSIAWLGNANANVTNFFYAGTPIYLSYKCYVPQQFDTFASLATDFGVTLAQLAQFNQWAACKAAQEIAIPNLVRLPSILGQSATITPLATDSLVSIAALSGFQSAAGTDALAIGVINQSLPGIFADNVSIKIGDTTVPVGPMDSLRDVAAKFGLAIDDFLLEILEIPGLYRTNGAILIPIPSPPPVDPNMKPEEWKSLSWNGLAERYRVQASGGQSATERLIETNRCLEGFLQKGAPIVGPLPFDPLTVGAYDTIDTLLRKFAAQNKPATPPTVVDLIQYNGNTDGLLTITPSFLLPPNPTAVDTALAPMVPPAGKSAEDAIVFPVSVTMKMLRNTQLVAPEFATTPAVYRSVSTFSPRGWSANSTSLNLTDFAVEFENAFAPYQLKCAVSQVSSGVGAETRALWAVNFGNGGVSTLAVEAQKPSFYAMAPLSTQLMGGEVWVNPFSSGCGLCPPVLKKFDGVDLDSWMRQFLSAVDLVLTPPYAVPAFQQVPGGMTAGVAPAGPLPFAEVVRLGSATDFVGAFATGPTGCVGCTGGTAINGPANFESIVNAKLTLAENLSARVMPILQGAGATGNYYGAVAQETLYQQMLVELSTAYSVDAIIQYPVDVTSPCVVPLPPVGPSGQLPPRISGDVTPALETVPAAVDHTNTLRASATGVGVSVPYFALVLLSVQGILLEGAEVTYNTTSHKVAYDETFDTLSQQFGESISPDNWAVWSDFFTAIQDQKILLSGATLPMVRVSRVVGVGATLDGIASFFGVDTGSVGQANQHIPDILVAGITIAIDGHDKYGVKAGQTLSDIALLMHPPISVALLAAGIGSTPGILTESKVLYFAQSLPDVTFSTTKVDLGRVGSSSGPAPALSFLFSVKHPRQYKNLFLNLKYVVRELEYGISNVSGTDGYQDSSWLTFLLPFGSGKGLNFDVDTAMPQVQVPIPLRSYPVPPTLLAQSGHPHEQLVPPSGPAQAIEQGKQWDYRVDFQGLNAAQDTDHLQVVFNAHAKKNGLAGVAADARTMRIFAALARFIDVYATLLPDLTVLTELAPGVYDKRAAVALQVFDTLVTGVAQAFRVSNDALALGAEWPELLYEYQLQTQSANGLLKSLMLTQQKGPSGSNAPLWPQVLVQSLFGPTSAAGSDAGFVGLTFVGASGMVATYDYPDDLPSTQQLTQRFVFTKRNVIQNQNAWGGIYLTRNDDLIASGPLGWSDIAGATGPIVPVPTNQAFLYETPLVRFVDPTTPLLVDPNSINVAGLTGQSASPRSLTAQIEAMLDAVLEWGAGSPVQADSYLSVLCSYGFPLSGSDSEQEIVATVPVRLVPTRYLSSGGKSAFATQLSASIQLWEGWATRSANGFLIFDLKTFTIPVGASGSTETLKPVLEFENLRIPVNAISG